MVTPREAARFLRSFAASPRAVGAVLPTSASTVRTLLDLAPIDAAPLVVELGAGTGPFTRELVRRLGPQGRLLAFELDPQLAAALAADIADPRVSVLAESAADLEAHLDGERPRVIVSALPFTSLPAGLRREILATVRRVLADDGVFLVLQYSPFVERELRRFFGSVSRHLSPLNVPPAVLYACRAAS